MTELIIMMMELLIVDDISKTSSDDIRDLDLLLFQKLTMKCQIAVC